MRKKIVSILTSAIMLITVSDVKVVNADIKNGIGYEEYTAQYYEGGHNEDLSSSSSSSDSPKWYYNTGLKLPKIPSYSKYNLLNVVEPGDIIYENHGGSGITGHLAIVEGIQYDSSKNKSYIRLIEAIDAGVCRSVLDNERFDEKGDTIYRVKNATDDQKLAAVTFCVNQLGKKYYLDIMKDTSPNEPDWYCSELVWAAYKNQGIDIETKKKPNEPGVTPHDVKNSKQVQIISYK